MQVMTNFQKDTGPSYLPWPPVDPAPKRASNPYAWVGVHMASEWFDNKFWVDLGVRAVYLIAAALLQVHPMENGKLIAATRNVDVSKYGSIRPSIIIDTANVGAESVNKTSTSRTSNAAMRSNVSFLMRQTVCLTGGSVIHSFWKCV